MTQLLTMARLDPDNRSRPFLPVDMTQLARSVAEDLSPIAEQKHIHFVGSVGNTDGRGCKRRRPSAAADEFHAITHCATPLKAAKYELRP